MQYTITAIVSLSSMRCLNFVFDKIDGSVLISNLVSGGMASVTDLYSNL
jgi:hypothetical protein